MSKISSVVMSLESCCSKCGPTAPPSPDCLLECTFSGSTPDLMHYSPQVICMHIKFENLILSDLIPRTQSLCCQVLQWLHFSQPIKTFTRQGSITDEEKVFVSFDWVCRAKVIHPALVFLDTTHDSASWPWKLQSPCHSYLCFQASLMLPTWTSSCP